LHPFAKKLDGIDLSPAMVVKAKERGLYDQLLVGDVLSVTGSYDLAVAADVLVYIGELGSLMEMVSRVLRPGGRFVFTVERADDGCNWRLGEKSRYRHSESYIRDITVSAGFSLEILDTVSTRSEAGQAVPGLLVVVKNG
jgi:predicted TPR repeat methyltransferase